MLASQKSFIAALRLQCVLLQRHGWLTIFLKLKHNLCGQDRTQEVALVPSDRKEQCLQHSVFVTACWQQIQVNCSNSWCCLDNRETLQYFLMKNYLNTMEKFSQRALFCLRVGKKLQDTELVTNHLNRITTDQVTGNLLFDCSHWRTIFTIQNQQQIVFTCSPQLLNHQKFFFIVQQVSFFFLLQNKNLCTINASKSDITPLWCLEWLVSVYYKMIILWLWFFFLSFLSKDNLMG